MSWILAFLGFALLIVLHELGHFFAAKAVGMRVEKFSLFFGKPIASFQRGETTYGVGSIPLGGYVKITGMSPDEARELEPELYARSYTGSKVWKRIVVIAAGPLVNVLVAFLLLGGIYWSQGRPTPGVAVGTVEAGLASEGVLKTDDLLLKVTIPARGTQAERTAQGDQRGLSESENEKRIIAMRDLIATGGCPAGTKGECADPAPIAVTYSRAGVTNTVEVVPKFDTARKRYRLGIGFAYPKESIGPISASGEAVDGMWAVTTATVKAMVKVVYDPEARKDVSSVVGGYETTRQSFEVDTVQALTVLALISLSLAIINLFPFLPLDGGHILWAVVEKIRGGKQVSTAVLNRASIVGLVLVAMLFLIGVTNDIGRIVDGTGFGVR